MKMFLKIFKIIKNLQTINVCTFSEPTTSEYLRNHQIFFYIHHISSGALKQFLKNTIFLHVYFNSFPSGWISRNNLKDYMVYKNVFSSKNHQKSFKLAIQEIESEIQGQNISITIKDIPQDELLATFQDHKKKLLDIFNQRRNRLDHFNIGNGFDYLTVLYQTVTSEQQQQMYGRIRDVFGQNKKFTKNYYDKPIVSLR